MKKRPTERPPVNVRLVMPADIHLRLKIAAAKAGITQPNLVLEMLNKHLPKVR